jgi:hypothetical protein
MTSRSLPSSPTSPKSATSQNFSFKVKINRESDRKDSILTSQKILNSSTEFEKVKSQFLAVIEANKSKIELEMKKNFELREQLEELFKSGLGNSKFQKRPEKKDSLIEYYRNKLEEIERLALSQKKEYLEMIKTQETENNTLRKMIRNNEKRMV